MFVFPFLLLFSVSYYYFCYSMIILKLWFLTSDNAKKKWALKVRQRKITEIEIQRLSFHWLCSWFVVLFYLFSIFSSSYVLLSLLYNRSTEFVYLTKFHILIFRSSLLPMVSFWLLLRFLCRCTLHHITHKIYWIVSHQKNVRYSDSCPLI